jgi:hypothetical protein
MPRLHQQSPSTATRALRRPAAGCSAHQPSEIEKIIGEDEFTFCMNLFCYFYFFPFLDCSLLITLFFSKFGGLPVEA